MDGGGNGDGDGDGRKGGEGVMSRRQQTMPGNV